MSIQIIPVETHKQLKEFVRFQNRLYKNDPHWVAPLEMERIDFLNPKKNPFFKTGETQLFLAMKNGECVGRISAQIQRPHLDLHKDQAGFFGFFDSVKDPEVARLLVDRASLWLKSKGMQKMRGPFNFTINDEVGVLVHGFDSPPYLLMNHNFSYYDSLLTQTGLAKCKDLLAWHYEIGGLPPEVHQIADATRAYPGLTFRTFDMKRFDEDVHLMMKMFNEVWSANWGFVPMSEDEIRHAAVQLKQIIDPNMAFFALVNGDPAAFSVCLPNLNEAIVDLKGKLFPFGWAKLLWRLKRKTIKSVRLCLLGIRKPYRGSALGSLSVLMNVESHRRGTLLGYKTGELSWTLEDNERINKGIEFMGGKHYKTYRVYEKQL